MGKSARLIITALALAAAVASARTAGVSGLSFSGGFAGGNGLFYSLKAEAFFAPTDRFGFGPFFSIGPAFNCGADLRYYFLRGDYRTVEPFFTAGAAFVDNNVMAEYTADNSWMVATGIGMDIFSPDRRDAVFAGLSLVGVTSEFKESREAGYIRPYGKIEIGIRLGIW